METINAKSEIELPETDKEWLYIAADKTGNRLDYNLDCIYSDGTYAVSTDGHRMHIQSGLGLSPGLYDSQLVKISRSEKRTFPNWEKLIPTNYDCDIEFSPRQLRSGFGINMDGKFRVYKVNDDKSFSQKYVDQALATMTNPMLQFFMLKNNAHALLITDTNGKRAIVVGIESGE